MIYLCCILPPNLFKYIAYQINARLLDQSQSADEIDKLPRKSEYFE